MITSRFPLVDSANYDYVRPIDSIGLQRQTHKANNDGKKQLEVTDNSKERKEEQKRLPQPQANLRGRSAKPTTKPDSDVEDLTELDNFHPPQVFYPPSVNKKTAPLSIHKPSLISTAAIGGSVTETMTPGQSSSASLLSTTITNHEGTTDQSKKAMGDPTSLINNSDAESVEWLPLADLRLEPDAATEELPADYSSGSGPIMPTRSVAEDQPTMAPILGNIPNKNFVPVTPMGGNNPKDSAVLPTITEVTTAVSVSNGKTVSQRCVKYK